MNTKKGMSLIVLVITILVMIILAGVVIVSMTTNNPIKKANEATIKQNAASYATELGTSIANSATQGNINDFINNDITGENMKKYIPSMSSSDLKKYEIVNGHLAYIGKDKDVSDAIKNTQVIDQNPYKLKTEVTSTNFNSFITVLGESIYNFLPNATNCTSVVEYSIDLKEINRYTLTVPISKSPYNPLITKNKDGEIMLIEIGETSDKVIYNNLSNNTGKTLLTRPGEVVQQILSLDQISDGTYNLVFASRIGNLNQTTFVKLDSNLNKISEKVIIPSNRWSAKLSYAQKMKNGNIAYAGYALSSGSYKTYILVLDKDGNVALENLGTGSSNESAKLFNLKGKIYYLKTFSATNPATYKLGQISEGNKIENERVFDMSAALPEGMNATYIIETKEGDGIIVATPGVGFTSSTYFTIIKFRMSDFKIRWSQRYENNTLFGDYNLFAGAQLMIQTDANKFLLLMSSKKSGSEIRYHRIGVNF